MPSYTVEGLKKDGPQYAMALLLNCLEDGEPFITYGFIAKELEYQLKIERIFTVQIGHVAGSLMDRLLEFDPKAPLINAMITGPNGVPGVGIGPYLAVRYNKPEYRDWNALSSKTKRHLIDREREIIFRYRHWHELNRKLIGHDAQIRLRELEGSERDGRSPDGKNHGGPAESDEHKKLKQWVAENPQSIGLRKSFELMKTEARLPSGDSVDVLFRDGNDFATVEVKSTLSNDEDFRRGIYQCVKYREVKKAEQAPNNVNVRAILVTERNLTPGLAERARLLKVQHKVVHVNE